MAVAACRRDGDLGFTQRVKSLFTAEEVKKEAMLSVKKVIRLILLGWNPAGKANHIPEHLNGIKHAIRNRQIL